MSTNSHIGYRKNNTYHYIHCQWDGYPSHHGPILIEHYNTLEKVVALVNLGAMSSLDISMECPEGHSFDTPVDGHCVFYTRDRGDDHIITHSESLNGLIDKEYAYLFVDGEWHVSDHGRKFLLLTKYFKDGQWLDEI